MKRWSKISSIFAVSIITSVLYLISSSGIYHSENTVFAQSSSLGRASRGRLQFQLVVLLVGSCVSHVSPFARPAKHRVRGGRYPVRFESAGSPQVTRRGET